MAVTTKVNVHRLGVTQATDYQDKRLAAAVRPALVFGCTNGAVATSEAIAALKTAVGDFHNNDATLPLRSIRAVRTGKTTCTAVARFERGPTSKPTAAAWLLASHNSGTYSLRYYQSDMSVGDSYRPNGFLPIVRGSISTGYSLASYAFRISTEIITVATVLAADPTATCIDALDTVNDEDITLAEVFGGAAVGTTYPAHTLLFNGYRVEPIDTPAGIVFVVRYQIEYMPDPGWVQQQFVYSPFAEPSGDRVIDSVPVYSAMFPLITSGAWVTNYVFPRRLADMSAMLPAHTP